MWLSGGGGNTSIASNVSISYSIICSRMSCKSRMWLSVGSGNSSIAINISISSFFLLRDELQDPDVD